MPAFVRSGRAHGRRVSRSSIRLVATLMLSAPMVPPVRADTEFADMRAAQRIRDINAFQSRSSVSAIRGRL